MAASVASRGQFMQKGNVIRTPLPDRRRALIRGNGCIHHGGQRSVVDVDQFRCIQGLLERIGDDESNIVACEFHNIAYEGRLRRNKEVFSIGTLSRNTGFATQGRRP